MIEEKHSILADAIAHQEGWYVEDSLPRRNNNPGDLRHANGEVHPDNQPDSVGSFATPEEGWAALERQLVLDANRGWNVGRLVYTYAPPEENDSANYLSGICTRVVCRANDLVKDVLARG